MTSLIFNINILLLTAALALTSCSASGNDNGPLPEGHRFSYDLNSPDFEYDLPDILCEISGISWYRQNKVACIQDEDGSIFLFDEETGKISDSYSFGKHGDYEDIAVYEETAWILESNGTLHRVTDFTGDNRKTSIFPTVLSARNDTEGLAYDAKKKNLLIACKNKPFINVKKKDDEGFRAIYRFGLNDKKLKERPEYLIDPKFFNSSEETRIFKKISLDLAKQLQLVENAVFNPSGLSIHPLEDDLYVISATPGRLTVMSRDGKIRYIQPLDKRIFWQPEGICFSPEGDLYISNEGSNGNGNILKFKYRPE